MCLYPRLILNRKYTANNKNGGHVPAVKDRRTLYVPIGCQECIECRKQKAREWQVRLSEDIQHNTNGKFVTLTFNKESYTRYYNDITTEAIINDIELTPYAIQNEIATRAVRHFLERVRKHTGKSIRHWLITELGQNNTERIHLHGIIWTDKPLSEIEQHWQNGWIWKGKEVTGKLINYVNERTVNYIIKYVNKIDTKHQGYKSKILCSKGIGSNYTNNTLGNVKRNTFDGEHTKETYTTKTGLTLSLPVYYRNKIYTEEQREQLWISKLDKQERWILGKKITIKNGYEEYNAALKEAQKYNREMGYKNDKISWSIKNYKNELREMNNNNKNNNNKNNKGDAFGPGYPLQSLMFASLTQRISAAIPIATANTDRSEREGLLGWCDVWG